MSDNYSDWSQKDLIQEIKKLKKRKKYGVVWDEEKNPEKVVLDCKERLPVLKENKGKEVQTGQEQSQNFLIDGDNYHALSVLNYTHKGLIDVIYIDPPYNTGNGEGFRYNDKIIDKEDTYRHSKWLSFMSKRLKLAKNLLKNSGVIFISIDDNEFAQLKLLCDETFGEKNFIALLVVQLNPRGRTLDKFFAKTHEYILVFAKKFNSAGIHEITKSEEAQSDYDKEDSKGKYRLLELRNRNPVFNRKNRPNLFYPIFVNPRDNSISLSKQKNFVEVYPRNSQNEDGCWTWGKEKVEKNLKELVGKNVSTGAWRIYRKDRLYKENGEIATTKEKALWLDKSINNENGKEVLKTVFGKHVFDFPKSVDLIKKCIKLSTTKKSTILDFFAGSGTTAHAVLELNNDDDGKRQYILCTNNENNICTDVCYPRVKSVINNLVNEAKGKIINKMPGGLKYFKTDFVDAEPTDKNKRKLVAQSTEMLCLKEGCFESVSEGTKFRIFKNNDDKYLGIIYDDAGIEEFKKEIKRFNKKLTVYVFSLDESAREDEFEDVIDKVNLKPIPEVILNVYRRIFK